MAGLLTSVLLAACGGGGNAARTVPASGAPREGSATIRLTIPPAASSSALRRSPQYVSPSTKSLLIAVQTVNGQATAFPAIALNVVVPSTACPAPAQGGQSEICTFSVILPVGSVAMTVTTYDQPLNGNTPAGNQLSSVTVTQQLSGNGDPILLTLNGVPASATLALGTPIAAIGTPSTIAVTATALDADGNLIVGPGNYAPPITVAVTDPTGRVTVSQASIGAPGANATLAYNGGSGLGKVTVTGSASGVTVHPVTLAFAPGLVRSDALSLLTTPVHYLTLSPDGSTLHIPYQDASNGNAPALLAVSAAHGAGASAARRRDDGDRLQRRVRERRRVHPVLGRQQRERDRDGDHPDQHADRQQQHCLCTTILGHFLGLDQWVRLRNAAESIRGNYRSGEYHRLDDRDELRAHLRAVRSVPGRLVRRGAGVRNRPGCAAIADHARVRRQQRSDD
jgi:hypothetical protein